MDANDNDVIDISHLSEEDAREHMRRIDQLYSCPCYHCVLICDRASTLASCDSYQAWLDYQVPERRKRRHR